MEIICPDIKQFCEFKRKSCQDDCNSQGNCLKNGMCDCYQIFVGLSCKDKIDCKIQGICEEVNLITDSENISEKIKAFLFLLIINF